MRVPTKGSVIAAWLAFTLAAMFLVSAVCQERVETTAPLPDRPEHNHLWLTPEMIAAALPTTTTTTTSTIPPPGPAQRPAPKATSRSGAPGGVWDALARCESGGRWHLNTGNGYYGGLQFSLRSWRWVGGTGYPHEHSRETQIAMAQRLLARQGWGAWPACSRKLGLR